MQLRASQPTEVAPAPTRAQIVGFEQELRKLPQLDIPTDHTFGPGFYARTIHLPAGAALTGKVHATEHVFILSKGELLVTTEDGRQHLKAPCQFVCRPGLKRAGYALTDVICTNVHITEETDLVKLEMQLIEPEDNLLQATETAALEGDVCRG